MSTILAPGSRTQAAAEINDPSGLRGDVEAAARLLYVADSAHVLGAMNSVDWERRGVLRRLTRRAR